MNAASGAGGDPRLDEILDTILRLAAGDLDARTTPSNRADALDAVMTGMNMLAEELAAQIDDLQQTQQQLLASEEKYRDLVDQIDDGILAVDVQGRINFSNQAWARMAGFDKPEQVLNMSIFDFVTPDDKQRVADIFRKDMARGAPVRLLDTSIVQPDGSIRQIQIHPSIVLEDGRVIGAKAVIRDTTEHHQVEQEIAYRASHDALTGLPNRAMALQTLDYLLAQAKRSNGFVAVLFLDLDEFKLVNDTLGHEAGDKLLRQAAVRLREKLRESDFVARLGGDEFLVLLPSQCQHGESSEEETQNCIAQRASTLAERLIQAIKFPFQIEGQDVYVGTSIGISLYPADAPDPPTLLQHADSAMYRVKETGRNGYQFYSEEMSQKQTERARISNELHRAIAEEEFLLLYQPVIELSEGRMVGVEALIRWKTTNGDIVSPADFIPVAEDTGLILPIGDWTLREACQQLHVWQQHGLALHMAVNLSARQVWQSNIVEHTLQTVAAAGIEVQQLELEVTETALMQERSRMKSILQELHEHGLSFSLDDFGTGYSSLDRLKKLPISKLKIDQSFVAGIPGDADDMAIVSAVIQMATSLGLDAVAEGVETAEQWRYLRDRGCRYGQGFYFSRPVPADAIRVHLAKLPGASRG